MKTFDSDSFDPREFLEEPSLARHVDEIADFLLSGLRTRGAGVGCHTGDVMWPRGDVSKRACYVPTSYAPI